MNKSPQSHQGKEKSGFWLLNPASKIESLLLILFFLFLPTQFGKHFWPDFSIVSGIRIDYLSPTLYTTDVILCLLVGFSLFRLHKHTRNTIQKKYFFLLGFFLFFLVCNNIFATRPLLSIYGWIKFFELAFLTLYLSRTIYYHYQLSLIALAFAISAIFESLLAMAQYLNQGSLNGIFYYVGERAFTGSTPGIANASIGGTLVLRPYATFSHPNVLAGYLLISMVLVWSLLLKDNKRWIQIIAGISLVLSSIALLLTFGRVAILIWALLLSIVFFKLLFKKIKKVRSRLVLVGFVLIGFGILGSFHLSEEIITRFSQTSLFEESVTERAELLEASLVMIEQHPILGVGQYTFIPALAPLQKPMPLGLYLQPVHNIFVLITAETGVVGILLFLWLLITTALRIKKQEARIKGIFFVLMLIIVITGSLDHYWLTLQQGQLLFATVIGLSWSMLQKTQV
jgi:hypothetical protein